MFEPVIKGIMRFSSNDAELGIQIHGHVIMDGGALVVIDPPMLPQLDIYLRVLGTPKGVIITNYHHSRGSLALARKLNVPLFVPDIHGKDEAVNIEKFKGCNIYSEETKLPIGIIAHRLMAGFDGQKSLYEEMVLQHGDVIATGDSAWGKENKLIFFPGGLFPDPENRLAGSIRKSLEELINRTGAKTLICGHWSDIPDGIRDALR